MKYEMQTKPKYGAKSSYRWYILILVVIALLAAVGIGLYLQYGSFQEKDPPQTMSESFYFTADLLKEGEETILHSSFQSEPYALYGGETHSVSVTLQNYYDETRVNAEDTEYEVMLENISDNAYEDYSVHGQGENYSAIDAWTGTGVIRASFNTQNQAQQEKERIYVTFQAGYADGTKMKLSIISKKTNERKLEINFILYTANLTKAYRIEDSRGANILRLIIMSDVEGWVPTLKWDPAFVNPDLTNTLLLDRTDDNIAIADLEADGAITLNRPLKKGESVSIIFFKQAPHADYSTTMDQTAKGKEATEENILYVMSDH